MRKREKYVTITTADRKATDEVFRVKHPLTGKQLLIIFNIFRRNRRPTDVCGSDLGTGWQQHFSKGSQRRKFSF